MDEDVQSTELINNQRPSWNNWFMSLAFIIAQRSIDPATKHGAVLSNKKHQILGVGYNGFPRGGDDCNLPKSRPFKYHYMVHAESNCIINSQNLIMSSDYTMHVTGMPCYNCMLLMIQSGIKHVVYGPVVSTCVDRESIKTVFNLVDMYNIDMKYYGGPYLMGDIVKKYDYFQNIQDNPFVTPKEVDNA